MNCTMSSLKLRKFPGLGSPRNLACGQGSHSPIPNITGLTQALELLPPALLVVGRHRGPRKPFACASFSASWSLGGRTELATTWPGPGRGRNRGKG